MPSLEEISLIGTALGERTIRQSRAMDLAWMGDQVAIAKGERPHHLHELIDRQLAEAIEELHGHSGSNPGANPGS